MGTDNIFVLHSLITYFVSSGKQLFCAFVDYVVRDNLWYKFVKLGIRGRMLNIIWGMYSCANSYHKIHIRLSQPVLCENGLRQRECISHFLFAIYINDLEETLIVKGIKRVDIVIVCR